MDQLSPQRVVRFGIFEADLEAGELRKHGVKVRLQRQPFDVLAMLLERPGHVVSRDALRARLWPSHTFVDFDHGLNKAVNKLRDALGDAAESPRFVETLPKRGYRFIAPVEGIQPREAAGSREPMPGTAPEAPGSPARRRTWTPWSAASGLAALGGLAVAAALGFLLFEQRTANAPGNPERTMLAVLPFANLEGDPEQDFFCDGMTDEMILQLSRLNPERLGVIARTSAMHYRHSAKRIDEIGRELGVEYVLEGTVRRTGSGVRVNARLVRARDQTPLWAESYERPLSDVLRIQTDVARRIADELTLELLPSELAALDRGPTVGFETFETYLRGRYHWNRRTPPDLERAIGLLESAIGRDPSYVPAYAALADALNVLPWYGLLPPREAYPRSKDLARRALEMDQTSASAHTALAYAYHYFDWNWPAAEREYARALELNPNYAQAHQWLAAHYAELGRFDEAFESIERAEQLDPQSLIIKAAKGWIALHARRYDEALDHLRRALAIDPAFVPGRLWLGQTYEALDRTEQAVAELRIVRELSAGSPTGLGELAHAYAAAGRAAEARALLDELMVLTETRYVEADLIARIHIALGERDRAIEWLIRGVQERAPKMVQIGVDPQFDPLRTDPRFQKLLRRLDLPGGW